MKYFTTIVPPLKKTFRRPRMFCLLFQVVSKGTVQRPVRFCFQDATVFWVKLYTAPQTCSVLKTSLFKMYLRIKQCFSNFHDLWRPSKDPQHLQPPAHQ